jgi:hypothetical protein
VIDWRKAGKVAREWQRAQLEYLSALREFTDARLPPLSVARRALLTAAVCGKTGHRIPKHASVWWAMCRYRRKGRRPAWLMRPVCEACVSEFDRRRCDVHPCASCGRPVGVLRQRRFVICSKRCEWRTASAARRSAIRSASDSPERRVPVAVVSSSRDGPEPAARRVGNGHTVNGTAGRQYNGMLKAWPCGGDEFWPRRVFHWLEPQRSWRPTVVVHLSARSAERSLSLAAQTERPGRLLLVGQVGR